MSNSRGWPRAWLQYLSALTAVGVLAFDHAGYAALMGTTLLLFIALLVLIVLELGRLYWRLKQFGWRSWLPLALVVLALPAGTLLIVAN